MIKIDVGEFWKYQRAGFLRAQKHENLLIWNYTRKAQIERRWDQITLKARGLITLEDGTVWARSFDKFFNLGEKPGPDLSEIPNKSPIITEKLDGFLGLTYWHKPTKSLRVASRGSFTSEYALWATEWLHQNCAWALDVPEYPVNTYVFEILYPKRRIVVDNSHRFGLVLIGGFENDSGRELSRLELEVRSALYRWPLVDVWDLDDLASIVSHSKKIDGKHIEGWVAYWPEENIRVKIKGADYCRIHKLATKLTTRRVWEMLWENPNKPTMTFEELEKVLPPDYYQWVLERRQEFEVRHFQIMISATSALEVGKMLFPGNRRLLYEYLTTNYPKISKIAMLIFDNLESKASDVAWRMLRPEHEIPIINEETNE